MSPTTRCWGYLSPVDTPFIVFKGDAIGSIRHIYFNQLRLRTRALGNGRGYLQILGGICHTHRC